MPLALAFLALCPRLCPDLGYDLTVIYHHECFCADRIDVRHPDLIPWSFPSPHLPAPAPKITPDNTNNPSDNPSDNTNNPSDDGSSDPLGRFYPPRYLDE